jgi:hypothetical protein
MTTKKAHLQGAKRISSAVFASPQLEAVGRQRIGKIVETENDILQTLRRINQAWFDRTQAEADLTSEFVADLTSARSTPETVAAVQKWTNQRMELAADDAQRMLADTQQFMEAGAHMWSTNWLSNGAGAGSKPAR